MKSILRLILMVLLNQNAIAQVNIDSLFLLWQDTQQTDSTRLSAINKLAWDGYLLRMPDSALHYAQLQYEFALKANSKVHIANALKTQGTVFYLKSDYIKSLGFYRKAQSFYEEIDDKHGVSNCLNNIANIFRAQGDFSRALDYYRHSLKIRNEIGDNRLIASSVSNIGLIYSSQGNYSLAREQYQNGLKIFEQIGDNQGLATCLFNIGETYYGQGDYATALTHCQRSLQVLNQFDHKKLLAANYKLLGLIYAKQGQAQEAMRQLQKSLNTYEAFGDKQGFSQTLIELGLIYSSQELHQKAIASCALGYSIAKGLGTIREQRDACDCLYNAYKALGNGNMALSYHESMLTLGDSLKAQETSKRLQKMEFERQLLTDSLTQVEEDRLEQAKFQEELRKRNNTRNIAFAIGLLLLIIAGGLYSRIRYIRKSKAMIEKERDKSDSLLHNILPKEVAQELKQNGKTEARNYDNVSILFSDFKGFTSTSEKLTAQELVEELNSCFEAFDSIMEKYGIEKIKTIGDAYMAAGGLPISSINSTKATVLAALEMQSFIKTRRAEKVLLNQPSFEMRVGVHTGPVVAGVVGSKKFQYDIWGDAVNTASRIESNSEAGKVNVSHATFELLKTDPDFSFISRGKIEAKGKGEIAMYYVSQNEGRD